MNTNPTVAAVTGSLFVLPLLAANAIVGNRIEPFFSVIRPGAHTSTREYVMLVALITLIPLGAFLAARPVLSRVDGRRRIYPLNMTVAAALFLFFVMLSVGLGVELYRCDVLGIPNCD